MPESVIDDEPVNLQGVLDRLITACDGDDDGWVSVTDVQRIFSHHSFGLSPIGVIPGLYCGGEYACGFSMHVPARCLRQGYIAGRRAHGEAAV